MLRIKIDFSAISGLRELLATLVIWSLVLSLGGLLVR